MAMAMQYLATNILLDSLQPMARQSAKTVEANIHMLADRMMTLAGNLGEKGASQSEILAKTAEIYELHTIALYDLDGKLIQGIDGAPQSIDGDFFALLQETDNFTTSSSTIFQEKLGITMGMPVKEDGETTSYVVGVYKYDTLNDVISSINLGAHSTAYMVDHKGIIAGHTDQSLVLSGSTLAQIGGENEDALKHYCQRNWLYRISCEWRTYTGCVLSYPRHTVVLSAAHSRGGLRPYDSRRNICLSGSYACSAGYLHSARPAACTVNFPPC